MYSNGDILVFNGNGFGINVIIQHAFIACMHLLSFWKHLIILQLILSMIG